MNVTWYDDFENVVLTFQNVGGKGVAKFCIEPSQYFNVYKVNVVDLHTIHINLVYHI